MHVRMVQPWNVKGRHGTDRPVLRRRHLSGRRGSVGIPETEREEIDMTITVLDPTNGPVKAAFDRAPRPVTLKGLTLGLIDNGKRHSDYMLKGIGRRLKDLHGFEGEIHLKKPSPSHAVSEDAARESPHLRQSRRLVICEPLKAVDLLATSKVA